MFWNVLFTVVLVVASALPPMTDPFTIQITYSGTKPCKEVISYVASLPREISENVTWSGIFKVEPMPDGQAGRAYRTTQAGKDGKFTKMHFTSISIAAKYSCEHQLSLAKKELSGNAAAASWVMQHPEIYADPNEFLVLVDGLAIQNQKSEMQKLFDTWKTSEKIQILSWDGKSYPTCAHLQQIVALRGIIVEYMPTQALQTLGCK